MTSIPTPEEVQKLLQDLHRQRDRLTELVRSAGDPALDDLAAAVDEIGEQLLVADEELRVQNEHLAQSTRRLDLLVAAHEELFASSDIAYLQTGPDGVVVRMNRAAHQLLEIPATSRRTRVIVNMFRQEDRAAVRQLINQVVHRRQGTPFGSAPEPLEATLSLSAGHLSPVVLTVRRSSDGSSEGVLLHWEMRRNTATVSPHVAHRVTSRDPHEVSVLQRLADAASDMAGQSSPAATLHHVAQQARAAIAGCDEVGVTLARRHGAVETPAATGELARACDRLQFELSEGPALGALEDDRPINVPDMHSEHRWPLFAPRAAELGVGSMLVLPLIAPRGVLGSLNLYARATAAFDEDSALIAHAFATHAGIALAHAQMESNLRTAMTSREEIGRAVGILMERHRVAATQAFDMLVFVSQRTHRKLRDIAAWVDATGEDPSVLLPVGHRHTHTRG